MGIYWKKWKSQDLGTKIRGLKVVSWTQFRIYIRGNGDSLCLFLVCLVGGRGSKYISENNLLWICLKVRFYDRIYSRSSFEKAAETINMIHFWNMNIILEVFLRNSFRNMLK